MISYLVANSESAICGGGSVDGDAEDEEWHGVELAATADGEAEAADAATELNRVVLVVQLQHVEFVILLNKI